MSDTPRRPEGDDPAGSRRSDLDAPAAPAAGFAARPAGERPDVGAPAAAGADPPPPARGADATRGDNSGPGRGNGFDYAREDNSVAARAAGSAPTHENGPGTRRDDGPGAAPTARPAPTHEKGPGTRRHDGPGAAPTAGSAPTHEDGPRLGRDDGRGSGRDGGSESARADDGSDAGADDGSDAGAAAASSVATGSAGAAAGRGAGRQRAERRLSGRRLFGWPTGWRPTGWATAPGGPLDERQRRRRRWFVAAIAAGAAVVVIALCAGALSVIDTVDGVRDRADDAREDRRRRDVGCLELEQRLNRLIPPGATTGPAARAAALRDENLAVRIHVGQLPAAADQDAWRQLLDARTVFADALDRQAKSRTPAFFVAPRTADGRAVVDDLLNRSPAPCAGPLRRLAAPDL